MIVRSISLEKELNEKVQNYCKGTGRTVSGIISVLLIKLLREQDGARGSENLPKEES